MDARFTRRRLLTSCGAVAVAATATAQTAPPRARGSLVYLDLDQADLDDAFDVVKASPNLPLVTRRWATNADAVRAHIGEPRRFAYGPSPIETLDVFATPKPNAPVQVFIHGGAFNMGTARVYAFMAEMFVRAGAHVVIPDFSRAQDHGGDPLPLLDQVQRSVAWVHRNAGKFGGDPDRIYVSGHSSGGELAALLLVTEWRGRFGLPADTLKGGLCCSTTYDLKALRLSSGGSRLNITDSTEEAMSVGRQIERLTAPIIIAVGSLETAWFRRRAGEFTAAVQAAGKPAQLIVVEGYNHFEVIETLANPYGALGRAVLEQMHL
ncbi:MAG: alpha/beta hydrolase [Caldimonas sp.]